MASCSLDRSLAGKIGLIGVVEVVIHLPWPGDTVVAALGSVGAQSNRGSLVSLVFGVGRLPSDVALHLALPPFSSYDMRMVGEEQIQRWADEAEAGYDVDELKRRGRGRPGRGAEPMQVVAVRLTVEELDALDAVAAKSDMSRSEAIRAALAHFAA